MDEQRYTALTKIAWAFVFTLLDFHVGILNILPDFIGFALIYAAIKQLEKEQRDLTLLKPFAIALILWTSVDWILKWFGVSADQILPLVGMIISLISLYFHFQLLTDLAQFAPDDDEGNQIRSKLLLIRNVLIVVHTATILGTEMMKYWEDMQFVLMWTFPVIFINIIGLIANLFALRRKLDPKSKPEATI